MSRKRKSKASKKTGDKVTSEIEAGKKKVAENKKISVNKKALGSNGKIRDTRWELSHAIAFWGLAILLFLPPYFRGLFFPLEQEKALIFATVIFWIVWLWKWSKRDNGFLAHPLDYLVLAFPVVYFISAFQAANYGFAVDEVIKTTLYFLVYWLVSRLVRNESDIIKLLQVIYLGAVGVALAGLATATGIVHINDGFLNGRIYSTFQYPNALASYLAAVSFIGFYLWHRACLGESSGANRGSALKSMPAWVDLNNFYPYLYAAGNLILLTVLLGTRSQGGLLVYAVAFILFVIMLPKGSRIPVAFHFVLAGILSLLAVRQFLSAVANNNMDLAWLWILIGLILVLAGQALYSFIAGKGVFQWFAVHRNVFLAALLLVVVFAGIGAGVYLNSYGDTVKSLVEEIKVHSASVRIYFFQDALKMFQERPLLGWGGGGWQEAYRAYQGYLYNSNEVHGHYFQIMVEAGISGLLIILGIWGVFLYITHRLYRGAKEDQARKLLVCTITIAALSIGFHAVIDFDLSLSALALVLWTMFGLARGIGMYTGPGLEEKKSKKYVPPNNAVLAAVSVVSFVIIVFAGSLVAAGNYTVQANRYLQSNNFGKGVELLQKASAYNPFYADYRINLARIYQAQENLDESIAEARKAVFLSKYSASCHAELAALYLNENKNSAEAVNAAEKALSLAPFQIRWYEFLARTYFTVGYNELVSGNKETAKQYFEKAVKIPDRISIKNASLDETEEKLWQGARLKITPVIKQSIGTVQYFMERWDEAEVNLQEALKNEKTKGEAAFWLAILREKQGRMEESQNLLVQSQELVPELAKRYAELKNLPTLSQ